MEDPGMEPEIDKYSSSDGGSKMNWMLDKGLKLGKKVLVTGIIISSAPFVLPPLMVFSALGLAFSVPSGLAVASYACTEKIMSKLLPIPKPPPPPPLDYDEEEDDIGFGREIGMGKEEEELMEVAKRGVGVRIEFVEDGKEGDQPVEENGYVEDAEDIPEEEEPSLEEEKTVQTKTVSFGENGSDGKETDIMKNDEFASQTTGLLERIRDEGKTNRAIEEGDEKITVNDSEELKKESEGKHIESIEKSGKESRKVTPEENEEMKEKIYDKNMDTILDELRKGISEGKSNDSVVEAQKPENDSVETIDVRHILEEEEEQEPMVYKKTTLVIGKIEDNSTTSMGGDLQLDFKEESVILSNADAREIADESGFDLFDDKNTATELYSHAAYKGHLETEQSPGLRGENGGYFMELPVAVAAAESEAAITLPPNEESEEKIWKRIGAMRAIVGYKAPPSATCLEELKALYIFTGVEPPASFQDPSDLVEISNRLQFLMSIIGVK